jgi:two-component system sensor histidine kinase DesK
MTDQPRGPVSSFAATGAPPAAWAAVGARGGESKDPWARFGWLMAVIWLVFLLYPLFGLLESDAPLSWVVVGWIALVAFAVIYVAGFVMGMRLGGGLGRPVLVRQWYAFGLLIVCTVLSIPAVGGNALSFLPFLMSFASYGLTRIWHWLTFAGALTATVLTVFLAPDGRRFVSILAIVALLGVVNTVSTWLILRSADAERLGLELATSEGREAVARDVHDLIGHSLTVVGLKAQLVRRLIDTDPEKAKAELADIEALTSEAIAGVRATVAGARATTLVEQLASSRDALASADVELTVEGAPQSLSAAQALTAAWILREATTNTLRHADATAVIVRIAPGLLTVSDDGPGPGGREGNGVRGMRERAAAAGAVFSFGPGATGGTLLEVTW